MKLKNSITILFALIFLFIGAFLLGFTIKHLNSSINKVNGLYTAQAVGNVYNKKVYMLVYNPVFSNGKTLSEYMGWGNPDTLVNEYINWLKVTTNNKVNYTVETKNVIADFTTFTDGKKYDEATYIACLNNSTNCLRDSWGNWEMMNYTSTINSLGICDNFNSGTIDELWMFGAPYMGWWEANQAGLRGFGTNGPVITGTSCNKPMNIMGFSYERGLAEMVEDLMHRTEGTMSTAYGSWQENSMDNTWDKYGLVAYQSPNYGFSGCGSCHYAPNSTSDYDWGNSGTASTYCDEFNNYPNPVNTTIRRSVTCSEWGCNGLGYFRWWLTRFPSKNGVAPDSKYADWWKYVLEPISVYDRLTYVPSTPTLIPTFSPTTVPITFTAVPRTPTPVPSNTTPSPTNVNSTPNPTNTNTTPTPSPVVTRNPNTTDNANGRWEILDDSEPRILDSNDGADNTNLGLINNINSSQGLILSIALFALSGLSLATGTFLLIKFIKPLSSTI